MAKEEVIETPKKPEELFLEEYKALCAKYAMEFGVSPLFKARDDGTYSIIINWSVQELPKK